MALNTPNPINVLHPEKHRNVLFNLFFVILLIGSVGMSIRTTLKYSQVVDDAYMFIRYADNIIKGGTYGWNLHEKTFGCTSIPYTFFILGLKELKLDHFLSSSQMLVFASYFWEILGLLLLYRTLKMITAGNAVLND